MNADECPKECPYREGSIEHYHYSNSFGDFVGLPESDPLPEGFNADEEQEKFKKNLLFLYSIMRSSVKGEEV